MPQVACLGILVADVVGKPIDAFPAKGTLAAVERMELHAGGCAANTGIALARLGVDVAVLGKVGRDGFGDFLLQTIRRAGADAQGVAQGGAEATSATMVAVDAAGERTFLHYPGANAAFTVEDVAWPLIEAADILHVAGPFLMPRFIGEGCADILRRAKGLGKITTLDTVWDSTDRWMAVLAPSLPHLDYLLPSLEEARRLTGWETPSDIAQVFLDGGVGVVGLKLGEQGCYVRAAGGGEFTVPPFPVEAVDALGAGDAWAAGFLCGLTHGWDLERTARFANAVGACAVQALGATTGIKSFSETCAAFQFADV
ncbi:MAG: sugar kinase [Armatimonadetes bacterium]|nr:sugar kinase [Armatimonadota bacterium]